MFFSITLMPDNQDLGDEYDAYEELMRDLGPKGQASNLEMGKRAGRKPDGES
jgi:hypothetical protein